jgi:TRAP-type mannitol/chloroaromatic compound transport system permease small subunit
MAQGTRENSDQKNKANATAVVDVPAGLLKATSIIDSISICTGKFVVAPLIIPMIGSLVFEVICRYWFDAPNVWASDMSTMLYGAFFMLGSAYALQRQQHIRTDFLYEKWSIRTKGIVDSLLYITLYFPGLGIFLLIGSEYALESVKFQERFMNSPWMPPIWPLKLTIPIATLLLLIQGVSELIKSLYAARTGLDLHESVEKVEI